MNLLRRIFTGWTATTPDPDPLTRLDRMDGLDSRRPTPPPPHVPSLAEVELVERANKRARDMIARRGVDSEVLALMARYDGMILAARTPVERESALTDSLMALVDATSRRAS